MWKNMSILNICRKIRLIECKSKCRHLKKFTCKGTLRQVFIWLRPRTPIPSTPYSLYNVYRILIHTGGGGGGEVELERMEEGQQFTKLGWKYQHDRLYLPRLCKTLINTCRKFSLQVNFFRWRHFALVSIYLISPCEYSSVSRNVASLRGRRRLFAALCPRIFRPIWVGGLGTGKINQLFIN